MFSDDHARRPAMERARDYGETTISSKVRLKQETETDIQNGFLMYLASYRRGQPVDSVAQRQNALAGFVYAPFRMGDLMQGILGGGTPDLAYQIFDGNPISDENLLFDSDADARASLAAQRPDLIQRSAISFGGHQWTLQTSARPEFVAALSSAQPAMIAVGGLVIDLLLFAVMASLASREERAREVAKAMVREHRSLAEALEHAVEGISYLDPTGHYVYVNVAYAAMLGYEPRELIGQSWFVTVIPEDRNRLQSEYERMLVEGKVTVEAKAQHRDGLVFHKEVVMVARRGTGGQLLGHHCFAKDCSERKQLEAVLADQAEQLRARNDELLHRNQELDEFSHIASHDLQEPLRKLVSFSKLLMMDLGGDLPERARQDLHFIQDAAKRMQSLVQDLLTLSHTGRAEMHREPLALYACVDDALDAMSSVIQSRGASIRCDALPTVFGEPRLITQIFQNLLSNALRFVQPGISPEIHITAHQDGCGFWIFGVRDNGIGIHEDYTEQIFQPFKRLHSRAEYEGSGIGLTICKKAVERHGGRIWVESVPGCGSHFLFTLTCEMEHDSWSKQPTQSSYS